MNWPVCRGASLPLVYPDYIASRLSSHVGPLIIRNSEYSTLKGPFLQKKTNKQTKVTLERERGSTFPKKIDSPASGAEWDTSRRQMLT
jgi:hypothetical protein